MHRRVRLAPLLGGLIVSYIAVVAIWALCSSGATVESAPSSNAHRTNVDDALAHGTREVLHVPLPGSTTTRDVDVYRPAVPDSADIPVLYFLHGFPGTAADVFGAGLPKLVDRLIAAGYPPFVLVAPDGNGVSHHDTEWANAVDGTDQFETFVTGPVIRAVEGSHVRDRNHRAIAGFSMGGYGAVNIALHHPDLYSQVIPIAGYFHVDDRSSVFKNELASIDANTPELHLSAARGERILVVDGDQGSDRVVKGESGLFYQQLIAAHVPASYEKLPGDHSWAFVASAFPDVMRFLEADWSTLQPPVPEVPSAPRAATTRQWQGTLSDAHVTIALLAAHDRRVAALDRVRAAVGAQPVSYVVMTVTNPSTAPGAVSLFKASFVSAAGTTIDANPVTAVLAEWSSEANRPTRGRRAPAASTAPRLAPDAPLVTDIEQLERSFREDTSVAPGRSRTVVLITTAVVRKVRLVFVGNSFAAGSLVPVS